MSQPRQPGRNYYQQQPPAQRPYQRPAAYPPPPPPPPARRLRVPGLGLILTLVGLAIQVLSLTVLPWVTTDAKTPVSASMPDIWSAATDFGTHGFGAWYVVLFSYPLAALGIVLALAAVLDSMVLKVVWACLALAGLGVLVLRFGLGPIAQRVVGGRTSLHFTTQEVTTAVVALVAGAGVIFVLKTALSMFRRVAGLILLALAGIHVAAVVDLVKGSGIDNLSFGAYGPALSYVLLAVAAFTAPRRVPGV